jgi:hypothetical protein
MVRSLQWKGEPMTSSNQHLMLDQVQAGMILSDELMDLQGHVLLPQGTVLTETMLALMPRHGIEILPILVSGASEAELAISRAEHLERLERLFRKYDPENEADWATGQLHLHITDFRQNQETVE